jgi:hypothetical protein
VNDDDEDTLPNVLAVLNPKGIYSIGFVEEVLPQFGITYTREDDRLRFGKASTVLGSRTPEAALEEEDGTEIYPLKPGPLVFDAVDLSQAILRLIAPRQPPAGDSYIRTIQWEADIALITALWWA